MGALLVHQIRMLRGALPGSDAARLREELRDRLKVVEAMREKRAAHKAGLPHEGGEA